MMKMDIGHKACALPDLSKRRFDGLARHRPTMAHKEDRNRQLNIVDFAWGMSRKATVIWCAGASRNATQFLRRYGDAGRRKKTSRALKFAREQMQVFLKGSD